MKMYTILKVFKYIISCLTNDTVKKKVYYTVINDEYEKKIYIYVYVVFVFYIFFFFTQNVPAT